MLSSIGILSQSGDRGCRIDRFLMKFGLTMHGKGAHRLSSLGEARMTDHDDGPRPALPQAWHGHRGAGRYATIGQKSINAWEVTRMRDKGW